MNNSLLVYNETPANKQDRENRNVNKIVGPFPINTIVCANALDALQKIPDNSFDVAIIDPPYNLSKGNVWKWDNSTKLLGLGGEWAKVMQGWDNMPLIEYFKFTFQWIKEIKRIVKPSGSFWVHGTYHNIGIINFILQLLKVEIINEVVWYKRNSFPNLSTRRLTASHETIIWAHTGKDRKYLFNYERIKKAHFPEDNLHKIGKQLRTVWDIPNNKENREIRFGKHPTQKPLRLLRRMLIISSKEKQKCLIPFAGSGSECVACIEHGLDFLAFETNNQYISIATKRINDVTPNIFASTYNYQTNSTRQNEAYLVKTGALANVYKRTIKKISIPPLIKWTGSKRLQAVEINSYFPEYKRYFEPFVGGGGLLFLNCNKETIASDIYEPLIKLWIMIRDEVERVIEGYQKHWHKLQDNIPEYFYTIRNRFNLYQDPLDLLFILRTCVNGITRFNMDKKFNNSFHLSRRGMLPETFSKIANKWSEKIQNVRFECKDYKLILREISKGDFVYLDPPYAGNKQRYVKSIESKEFFCYLNELNSRGVKYALSFDGFRNGIDLRKPIPKELYKRKVLIPTGNSAVKRVLNGQKEKVEESLYLNYFD